MQVEVAVKYLQANFYEHGLFGFGDFTLFIFDQFSLLDYGN